MKQLIIITGPTAAGKTDFALELGTRMPIEIINGDMGQLYAPLSIGTAKPAWKTETIPHHLFDHVSEPMNYTVTEYRTAVKTLIAQIQERGNTPVIVGGSTFYVRSLFFPPSEPDIITNEKFQGEYNWETLKSIDPERASKIDPHDRYRIERALDLWHQTGSLPSTLTPAYDPVHRPCRIIYCFQKRATLYDRINRRTLLMLKTGWLDEVKSLSEKWRTFLKTKKIIGYAEIDRYLLERDSGSCELEYLVSEIQQKTRNYAKRQETAWRTLKKCLKPHPEIEIDEFDLTLSSTHLYIDGLLKALAIEGSRNYDKKNR